MYEVLDGAFSLDREKVVKKSKPNILTFIKFAEQNMERVALVETH